jgi:hypothetical protein
MIGLGLANAQAPFYIKRISIQIERMLTFGVIEKTPAYYKSVSFFRFSGFIAVLFGVFIIYSGVCRL